MTTYWIKLNQERMKHLVDTLQIFLDDCDQYGPCEAHIPFDESIVEVRKCEVDG